MTIATPDLPGFIGEVIAPDAPAYSEVARTAMAEGAPALVLRPADAADVSRAVRFAAASGLPLAVRGGGHSVAGLSTVDDGVVIDLSRLDEVRLLSGRRVHVGGGATWRQVAAALSPHGLAISSGDTADVGVGGLTLSGGIGWMVRRDGLTLDSLRAVELVTASGELLTVDAEHHPDLFWAVRGGGGAFGIVTRFEFEARPTGTVVIAKATFAAEDAERVVPAWARHMRTAPAAIGSVLTLANPQTGGATAPVELTMVRSDGGDLEESLAALRAVAAPLSEDVQTHAYADILHEGGRLPDGLRTCVRSGFVPADAADRLVHAAARIAGRGLPSAIVLHSLGGAFSAVGAHETAFAHRDAELMITTFGVAPEFAIDGVRARLADVWRELEPHVQGSYANSLDGTAPDAVAAVYPPMTMARLEQVKAEYDPENVFTRHFSARVAAATR